MRQPSFLRLGFTLIELLIVVAIIAILAAIAVPNFLEAQTRSKVSRCKSDMRTLATALESYAVDANGKYAPEYIAYAGSDGYRELLAQKHLTTPIAYISSILLDPFKSKVQWKDQGYYRYWNWLERYGHMIDFNRDSNQGKAPWFGGEAAWMLQSFGPDQDTSWQTGPPVMVPYEATNGTVSFGDILRFGPGGYGS